jgi:predicted Fe-Mo cluster-binding NifX family protein
MARSFAKRSALEISSRGIDCITTNIENIDQAISSYLDGQVKGFEYFYRDAKDFMPCTQRAFKW